MLISTTPKTNEQFNRLFADFTSKQQKKAENKQKVTFDDFAHECVRLRELFCALSVFASCDTQKLIRYLEEVRNNTVNNRTNNLHTELLCLIDTITRNDDLIESLWDEYRDMYSIIEEQEKTRSYGKPS